MDTSDPDIKFDELGVCNYCNDYKLKEEKKLEKSPKTALELQAIVKQIKRDGEGRAYDCLMGLSGGVDSSYATYLLKELGLRTLVVHMDNGWNSELSVMNIEKILNYCKFDLYTNVLEWNEFRQMQLAYLRAGVLDLEALTDHAINATVFKAAEKFNIKYIINGSNPKTESILPLKWRYDEKLTDATNIKSIVRTSSKLEIKHFPFISLLKYAYLIKVKKIETIPILEYGVFNKKAAMKVIMEKMDWRDYGGKHYESVITRFYQGYILPNKFGIDKRKAHLSSLIVCNQLDRSKALEILEQPILEDKILESDLEFVPKKLRITQNEFQDIMEGKIRSHYDFKTNKLERKILFTLNKILSKFG